MWRLRGRGKWLLRIWLGEFKLSKRFDYERYWLEPFIEMQGITTKDEIRYTNGSRVPINMFFVGLEAGF